MRSLRLIATCLCILSFKGVLAITIQDAVKQGKVKFTLKSNGLSLEDGMLNLKLQNVSITKIDIEFPLGTKLLSEEEDRQDLILVKEEILVLMPKQEKEIKLIGMCIQAGNRSPGQGAVYSFGPILTGDLLDCVKVINKDKIYNSCGQEAIWAFSDNHEIGWISAETEIERNLRQFVADKKGVVNPWYTTNHLAGNNQLSRNYDSSLPAEEYYERFRAEVSGDFNWKQLEKKKLTFAIYDSDGNVVRKFFENKDFDKGEFSFKFNYSTTKLSRGTYFAKMTCGNELIQEESFTF